MADQLAQYQAQKTDTFPITDVDRRFCWAINCVACYAGCEELFQCFCRLHHYRILANTRFPSDLGYMALTWKAQSEVSSLPL